MENFTIFLDLAAPQRPDYTFSFLKNTRNAITTLTEIASEPSFLSSLDRAHPPKRNFCFLVILNFSKGLLSSFCLTRFWEELKIFAYFLMEKYQHSPDLLEYHEE